MKLFAAAFIACFHAVGAVM
jgi:hypothetical protein